MWTAVKFILFALCIAKSSAEVIHLEKYNVDPNMVTVSGLSSGGAMATQFHVIHSSEIKGAAMFAGIVYHCSNGLLATALNCMSLPGLTNVQNLIEKTEKQVSAGSIDDTSNIHEDKIFIFQGTKDATVLPDNGNNIEEFYQHYLADIKTEFTLESSHAFPTDYYGPECDHVGGYYINNCNYNGAFEALNHMYDDSLTPTNVSQSLNGNLEVFSQSDFFYISPPSMSSMDSEGFIYIPSGCVDKTNVCKLHIAFHGCHQGREEIGDIYASNTGFLQVAEMNNIIVLFPQAIKEFLVNPNGCWDWWGYTNYLYTSKSGNQILAIHRMMEKLIQG